MTQKVYNSGTGRFADGLTKAGARIEHYAQHATAFALANQVYENQKMAVKMADSLKNEGINKMSMYGTFFLLQGLYNSNQGVLARQIMSNPSDYTGSRTWANMMYNTGATLTTEAWDSTIKSNMSYSHAWGSAPGTWLIQGLFGIKPTEPGWNETEIKLQPGGVESASVSVPTTKGKISADYKIEEDGTITLQMKIPSNMKMKIIIPGTEGQTLRINGTETEVAYNTEGYLETTLYGGSYLITGGQSAIDNSELKECQNIVYRSCGKDWSAYETDGGTTGKSQPLHKIQMRLNQIDGNVKYSVHVNSKGWLGWAKNGELAGSSGMTKRLEAIEIKVVPKGENIDRGRNAYYSKEQTLNTEQTVIDEEQSNEEITQEPENDDVIEKENPDSSDNKDLEEITGEDNEKGDDEIEEKSEENLREE